MKGFISDPAMAVDPSTFDPVLDFVARHCIGVLYDETLKSFCILGDEQSKLVKRKEQPLSKPTIIYGLAGTGKTISVMARIQLISGNLDASCKALYVCFEDNAIAMVKKKLEACQVDLTHITLANFNSLSHNLGNLISQKYRYIYLDSVEDLGVDWVNRLLEFVLLPPVQNSNNQISLISQTFGDFWITMDPFQGLRDTHSLVRDSRNHIQWQGSLVHSHLLEEGFQQDKILNLKECFRMPLTAIEHLEREKILPVNELPKASDVASFGVIVEDLILPARFTIKWIAEQLAHRLFKKVMPRGIHPGHCSVLYDHKAKDDLFPLHQGGLSTFLQMVNSSLRTIPGTRQASHMLQLTHSIENSLLYNCNCKSEGRSTPPLISTTPFDVEETVEFGTERHSEVKDT